MQVVKTSKNMGEVHRCGIDEAVNISKVVVVTASEGISLCSCIVIELTERRFLFFCDTKRTLVSWLCFL